MNAIPQPETFQIADASAVSAPRRNPGSVAEMLAVLADMMALQVPKSDAEIDAMYGADDADDDAKWDDRDPDYLTRIED
jgi:hypothetical protein